MFKKILIANRGEIAVRDHPGLPGDGDQDGGRLFRGRQGRLHTLLADEAICIGPAPSTESYLNMERILTAMRGHEGGCHPSGIRIFI